MRTAALLRLPISFFLILVLASCKRQPKTIERSFYYWKTDFAFNERDLRYVDSLQLKRLYVRFFDIHPVYGEPAPEATIQWNTLPPAGLEIVPCVYIVNRSIEDVPSAQIPVLAANIEAKIDRLRKKIENPVPEIQLDCDWTETTKEKYFQLLALMKSHFNEKGIRLSATIRLHQIKYAGKTGVPPVNRGMLMFYNTGKIQDKETANSILELETAEKYITNLNSYPLSLDVAYPIYSWGVWFRNDSIHDVLSYDFSASLRQFEMFKEESPGKFRCTDNGFFDGHYFLENDLIRIEKISPEVCRQAAERVASELAGDSIAVSLYHWDLTYLHDYGKENIDSVYSAAR